MRLPLEQFLKFFNITKDQYLDLPIVPFPIVTDANRVVYKTGSGDYVTLDMRSRSPADTDRTPISDSVAERLFVHFGVLNKETFEVKSVNYRNGVNVDRNRTLKSGQGYRSQTADSTEDLYFNEQGHYEISSTLISFEYPFTSFDLVNDISPLYAQILNPEENKGSVVNGVLTIKSTKQKGTISMSTENSSIIDQNRQALVLATKLEVGSLALDLISEQVLKAAPAPVALMIGDNPLVKVAIANLVNVIVQQTGFSDSRVDAVNEAMMTVSWMEVLKAFDVKSIFENVIAQIPTSKLETLQKPTEG